MNLNTISVQPHHVHDPLLKILRVEWFTPGATLYVEKQFCQLAFQEHPERMVEFFRELADQIEKIVS